MLGVLKAYLEVFIEVIICCYFLLSFFLSCGYLFQIRQFYILRTRDICLRPVLHLVKFCLTYRKRLFSWMYKSWIVNFKGKNPAKPVQHSIGEH